MKNIKDSIKRFVKNNDKELMLTAATATILAVFVGVAIADDRKQTAENKERIDKHNAWVDEENKWIDEISKNKDLYMIADGMYMTLDKDTPRDVFTR